MPNEYVNKVVIGGVTKIDLTADTVTANKILSGFTAHDKSGAPITGTCAFDSDTSGDTAAVAEILVGKTAHARGALLTGTMPNNGAVTGSITTKAQEYTVPQGYHDGAGKVGIAYVEQAKIVAGNIKNGVEILGVTGTYTGSELIKATTGSATPTMAQQVVLPSSLGDYDYFTQFTVAAIPVTYVDNAAGGQTCTVG